ncbi:hypothetical protein ACFWPV_00940 [Streptomyces uncialis]|uniref:hypothetical protein n=1 Tax=Streptomyces uncialis TaxID=1048205 RepID=UPI0036607EF2
MTTTQDRQLTKRLGIAIALVALLPFVLPLNIESRSVVNGELTSYSYLNITALVAAVVAISFTARTFSGLRHESRLTTTYKALLIALVVVSVFQLVRGSGVIPTVTECTASYSFDLCRPDSV